MKKIVILDRGWVLVGRLEEVGKWFVIQDGSVVRRWGTTHGLGQLAEKGPLPNTILDPIPTTRFKENQIIMTIDCYEEVWK